jgi:hypothetical protein
MFKIYYRKPHLRFMHGCWRVYWLEGKDVRFVIGMTPEHAWGSYLYNTVGDYS